MSDTKKNYLVIILGLIFVVISKYLTLSILMTDNILLSYYSSFLPYDLAQKGLIIIHENIWIFYLLGISTFTLKILAISVVIYTGFLFTKETLNIKFKEIIISVILANFIFIIKDGLEIIYFTSIRTSYNLKELESFNLFSLYSLVNINTDLKAFDFFLGNLNLFQIGFSILLAYELKNHFSTTNDSIKFVFTTYGLSLLTYCLLITYLKLLIIPI